MSVDPLRAPLAGTLLVEASAGTGKTWTIGALVLRLILEAGRSLPEILVLTFTEAATAELRQRLRSRLAEARAALLTAGTEPLKDEGLAALRERLVAAKRWDPPRLARQLEAELAQFDEASIFTIHGFCLRVLRERPLESGAAPGAEIAPGEDRELRETVEDELRRHWAQATPGWLAWLSRIKGPKARGSGRFDAPGALEPECWLALLRARQQHPLAALEDTPMDGAADPALAEAAREALLEELRYHLSELGGLEGLEAVLLSPERKGNIYNASTTPVRCRRLVDWLMGLATLGGYPAADFVYFTPEKLARGTKKTFEPPTHPFFAACERLQQLDAELAAAYSAALARLLGEALENWPEQARRRRRAARRLTFDDVLHGVARALDGPGGEVLAERLRERWTAVLVDEFQDTDPLQAGIFRRAFQRPERPLVFVGDPKQAIYTFRGADIHAYLAAARTAGQRASLDRNWRSRPPLITAVNRLFAAERFPAERGPFLQAGIAAPLVRPPEEARDELHLPGGAPALRVVQLPEDSGWNLDTARRAVAADVAARIASLLAQGAAGEAWIQRATSPGQPEPLCGRHLAVLVRTHREGRLVAEALAARGLPSVLAGEGSLWQCEEAAALAALFDAIARPGEAGLVLAALAGPIASLEDGELAELSLDPERLGPWQDLFASTARSWQEQGFAAALRGLLRGQGWLAGALERRGGERRATNLLHLADVLQAEASLHRRSPAELAARLRELAADPQRLEATLRLESDEQLVQVVTLHRSKGLEYDLVFVPFLWAASENKPGEFDLRRLPGEGSLRLRPLLPGHPLDVEEREALLAERLAEDLRLAYVGLTRAKLQTVIHDGKAGKDGEPAALDWLLLAGHAPETLSGWKTKDPEVLAQRRAAWETLADGSVIATEELDEHLSAGPSTDPATLEPLAAAPPPAALPAWPGWRLSSFSSLVAGLDPEEPDHDRLATGAVTGEPAPEEDAAGRFPRGAKAGSALHALLERPFRRPVQPLDEAACAFELARFGLDPALGQEAARWLHAVLAAPVDDSGWSLSRIEPARALPELEFQLDAGGFSADRLRALLEHHDWPASTLARPTALAAETLVEAPRRLAPSLPAGLLKGFVDLVYEREGRWWLLDWKSNRLGPCAASYSDETMAAEMLRAGYLLQGLLYGLALHRHLSLRLADYDPVRHLGGWQYVFLRGVDGRPGAGIVSGTWPPELLVALDALVGRSRSSGGVGHD
jgi:exodeoxyribonuclease V beta subunit